MKQNSESEKIESPEVKEEWHLPRWLTFGVIPLFLSFSLVFAGTIYLKSRGSSNPYHLSPLEQLMGLSTLQSRVASDFTLVDQRGKSVSLSQFKGKAVLLTFMDSRCTEVCPVLAQEFLLAEKDLGANASKVVFVAVNVNPQAESVADVANFTRLHGLDGLPNWYFLTGSTSQLSSIWQTYGVTVELPANAIQTIHSDPLYFLAPSGEERYLASPVVDQRKDGTGYLPGPTLVQWGKGIATVLRKVETA